MNLKQQLYNEIYVYDPCFILHQILYRLIIYRFVNIKKTSRYLICHQSSQTIIAGVDSHVNEFKDGSGMGPVFQLSKFQLTFLPNGLIDWAVSNQSHTKAN